MQSEEEVMKDSWENILFRFLSDGSDCLSVRQLASAMTGMKTFD
jgi:hypothetical protein